MGKIVKEGVDQVAKELGYQLWAQTMRQAEILETLNMINSNKLNSLRSHMLKSLTFYPNSSYLLDENLKLYATDIS